MAERAKQFSRKDVFISYSRRDKSFVQPLNAALEQSSHEAWIDWKDIPPSTDWWQQIEAGIEEAHTFIFVISGASVASRVCRQEIDHADLHNKRIIPIVRRSDFSREDLHPALAHLQWLYFREEDDFDQAFGALVKTIDTDLDYTKSHTQLLMRSLEWHQKDRDPNLLIRGSMLEAAEEWLIQASGGKQPKPTELQSDYIISSRREARNRQRTVIGVLGSLLLLALGAGGIAYWQFRSARSALATAEQALIRETEARDLAETRRTEAEAARQAESLQRQIAQFQRQEAETALQQAEAAKKAEAQQRQQAQKAQKRAEVGELKAQEQTKIAQRQTRLAEINAAAAEAATLRAEQEAFRAEQEALNATIQAEALTTESLMASGLNFKALLQGLEVAQTIREIEATAFGESNGLKRRSVATQDVQNASQLQFSTRLQAISTLREAVYGRGWREKNTLRGHAGGLRDLTFSPDGRIIASTSSDNTIKLWERSGKLIRTLQGHTDDVNQTAFSPDGNLLASSGNDGTVRLWDLNDGSVKVFEGHIGWVSGLNFAPNGNRLASSGADDTIRLWDLAVSQRFVQERGELRSGAILADRETFFAEHVIHQEAGQKVFIRLESEEFDTFLKVIDGAGNVIAQSDDSFGTNAALNLVLQATGAYRIVVTSYAPKETGAYTLSVRTSTPEMILEGHSGAVMGIAFSPDGEFLASASRDGTARLWDRAGNQIQVFEGHSDELNGVTFAPDGRAIATIADDDTARLWQLASYVRPPTILQVEEDLVPAATLPDKGTFYTEHSFDGMADQKVLIRLQSDAFDPLVRLIDPRGNLIAANDDRFGLDSGVSLRLPETGRYRVIVTTFAEEEEGPYYLGVLDTTTAPEIVLEGHTDDVRGIDFSPNSEHLVTSGQDATLRIWHLNGEELQVLKGHRNFANDVHFSPDGTLIASAGGDRTLKLWQPVDATVQTLEGHRGSVEGVSFGANGEIIASAGLDDTVRLWNGDGSPVNTLTGHSAIVYDVRVSPNGQLIASGSADHTVRLWSRTGEELHILEGHSSDVNFVGFAPNGKTLASASDDGTVKLWDVASGELLRTLVGHGSRVYGIVFDPSGQRLASAGEDGTVRLWTIHGQELKAFNGHAGDVWSVRFSPDGQTLASASNDGTVILWNADGRIVQRLEGHTAAVFDVNFAPNGQALASASSDGTIKLWDLSGRELQTLEGHQGNVWSIDFASDGRTLASGSQDGTIMLWNLDLDDLIFRGCDWLRDYMANPATPPREKNLCKGIPQLSNGAKVSAPISWTQNVWSFWQGLLANP